jgi:hypothetical protein
MPFYIDVPQGQTLNAPISRIAGWYAREGCQLGDELHFRIGDAPVPCSGVDRPDVRLHYPRHKVWGFEFCWMLAGM